MPKIGGSFVEEVLCGAFGRRLHKHTLKNGRISKQIYNFLTTIKPFCYWSVLPQIFLQGYAELLKHGFADDLPRSKKQLVLGAYRHPLDRYISQYEFRWLARSGQTHVHAAEIQKSILLGHPQSHSVKILKSAMSFSLFFRGIFLFPSE